MRTAARRVLFLCAIVVVVFCAACSCKIKVRTGPDTTPSPSSDMGTAWAPLGELAEFPQAHSVATDGTTLLVGALIRGGRVEARTVLLRSKDAGVSWEYKLLHYDQHVPRVAMDAKTAIAATYATIVSPTTNQWTLLNRPAMSRGESPVIGVATYDGKPYIVVRDSERCSDVPGSAFCSFRYVFDGRSWIRDGRGDISLIVGSNGSYAGVETGDGLVVKPKLFRQNAGESHAWGRTIDDNARRTSGALGANAFVLWNATAGILEFYSQKLAPLGSSRLPSQPLPMVVLKDDSVVFAPFTSPGELYRVKAREAPTKIHTLPAGARASVAAVVGGRIVIVGMDVTNATRTAFWAIGSDDDGTTWKPLYRK